VTWVRSLEQLRSGCVNAEGLLNHGARDVGLEDLSDTRHAMGQKPKALAEQAKLG
jgi:hypothetical protein